MQKGHQILVNEQCLGSFQIGNYRDEIICNVMPMDACHILLGRPWQYDRKTIYDGEVNTYKITKDTKKYDMTPVKEKHKEVGNDTKVCVILEKQLLKEIPMEEMFYALVSHPK